jgi:hypothetical protein
LRVTAISDAREQWKTNKITRGVETHLLHNCYDQTHLEEMKGRK